MASKRISELSAISALDDDDVLVVIEDGATKKVTVAELRAALRVPVVLFDETKGSAGPNFDVTSIPATYQGIALADLECRFIGRSDVAAVIDSVNARFNNDSGNNYDIQYTQGAGGSTGSNQRQGGDEFGDDAETIGFTAGASSPAGAHGEFTMWIRGYASTVFNKGFTSQGGVKYSGTHESAVTTSFGEWRSTAAITRVTFFLASAEDFITGSRLRVIGHF